MNPTDEQLAMTDAFLTGDSLVGEAGAGTGKTSTTVMLAQSAPERRGLYVSYNKAIVESGRGKFPDSVRLSTAHALAYGPVGSRFKARLNGPRIQAWRAAEIMRLGRYEMLSKTLPISSSQVARLVMSTIDNYVKGDTNEPEGRHVPSVQGLPFERTPELREVIVPLARAVWAGDLQDPNGQLKYSHNYYLKTWALTAPHLPYDYIIFDEAQDANPVMAQIVGRQDCQKVYVGDRCQAINGWNGAIDAMENLTYPRLYLSQSFRFGPQIAENANDWLGILDTPLRLKGWTQPSVVGPVTTPAAILCRTNAGTIQALMAETKRGRKACLNGSGDTIKALAYAARDLLSGKRTSHPELFLFPTWDAVEEYAKEDAGADLAVFVKLINAHGPEAIIQAIERSSKPEHAEVTISTAHRAKGLEWDSVRIFDDFQLPTRQGEDKPAFSRTEAMLAYVAVTRARLHLDRGPLTWASR